MPLKRGTSNKTRSKNIKQEIRSGRSPKQASAIAYSMQRRAIAKKGGRAARKK